MTTHELIAHNGGAWRCTVCGRVFPFDCAEEILKGECAEINNHHTGSLLYTSGLTSGLYSIDPGSLNLTDSFMSSSFDDPPPSQEAHKTRRPDTAIRKGERLIDAWMNERGEGDHYND